MVLLREKVNTGVASTFACRGISSIGFFAMALCGSYLNVGIFLGCSNPPEEQGFACSVSIWKCRILSLEFEHNIKAIHSKVLGICIHGSTSFKCVPKRCTYWAESSFPLPWPTVPLVSTKNIWWSRDPHAVLIRNFPSDFIRMFRVDKNN